MRHHQSIGLIPRSRSGFTLVELLVAIALTITIMGIIGWAMGKSVDTFRNLRAIADLQTRLRSAEIVLRRDLAAEHFGGNHRPGFGGPFVSDQRLDLAGWTPPDEGFFTITQATPTVYDNAELNGGLDNDGIPSYAAVNHTLHFTARYSGKRDQDYVYASAPGNLVAHTSNPIDFRQTNTYTSRWAELFYFLVPNGNNANGTTLYTLYRRQRAVMPGDATGIPGWSPALRNQYPDIACNTGNSQLVTSATIGVRSNRMPYLNGGNPGWRTQTLGEMLGGNNAFAGNDILLTDVISFDVRVLWYTGSASVGQENLPSVAANRDWPFANLPASPRNGAYGNGRRCFDTWSRTEAPNVNWDDPGNTGTGFNAAGTDKPPLRIRVQALQIRIRIWDFNTQQTRQMTFVQDI